MKWIGGGVVGLVIAIAAAVALAQGGFTTGTVKYKYSGILTLFDAPAAACKAGVQQLNSQGQTWTYASVKEGADRYMTCVLRGSDNSLFEQDNIITKKMICPDGNESISMDNSGTWASQGCPCDPELGCPQKGAPPTQAAETATGSGSGSAPPPPPPPADTCTPDPTCSKTPSPPHPENSPRCTQKPAPAKKKSQKAIAAESARNRAETAKNRSLVKRYAAERAAIEDTLMQQKEDKRALVHGRKDVYPTFGKEDFCPGNYDVNIGMLCGSSNGDYAAANNVAGLPRKPKGCTWHHHQDLGRMQLIKETSHSTKFDGKHHWGGSSIWRRVFGIKKYPSCCPKS